MHGRYLLHQIIIIIIKTSTFVHGRIKKQITCSTFMELSKFWWQWWRWNWLQCRIKTQLLVHMFLIVRFSVGCVSSKSLFCLLKCTCTSSNSVRFLKFSQAIQKTMFSSLNSFFKNSCQEITKNLQTVSGIKFSAKKTNLG